jgi:O-antigen/teichoic acid export membrane protein
MTRPTTLEDSPPGEQTDDIARLAGRGTIYITAAKAWFIASGYAIHFTLPRLMSAEQYGLYQVVVGVVSIINAVIIAGTYQTVSKYISQDRSRADSVKVTALKMQSILAGCISIGFIFLSPFIADLLNDPRLVNYLRLGSLITLCYCFYSVFTGYFNGLRRFLAQAGIDAAYSTLKLSFVVLFVWLGYGAGGGIAGFALAAATALAISIVMARKTEKRGAVSATQLFKFQAYLLAYTLAISLLQRVDLMLIKALSSSDIRIASENAAYYSAATNIANITYQAIVSITLVIFPLVSASTFAEDIVQTRTYISRTLRYSLIIMALSATLFSANASEILFVIYPQAYQRGGEVLPVISVGMLFFGVVYILTTVISAGGRPKVSLGIGMATLAISAALNTLLIPMYGLLGAGLGTTIAMLAGACACGAYVLFKYGALIPAASVLRVVAISGVIYLMSRFITPSTKLLVVVQLAGLGMLYLILLLASGELRRSELQALKRIVR